LSQKQYQAKISQNFRETFRETRILATDEKLRLVSDIADSPKLSQLLRNTFLALLESGDEDITFRNARKYVSDADYRAKCLAELSKETPDYWTEEWDAAYRKEIEPLYSKAQQQIVRRRSLIKFWTKEWIESISEKEKSRLFVFLDNLAEQEGRIER
jgi:hypothetical protein